MKKSFLEGLDSYLEDFEGKMIAEENLGPMEPEPVQRAIKPSNARPSRIVKPSVLSRRPNRNVESEYDIVEEEIVVIKPNKPKVKKIVETDTKGNILNVRYVPINEGVDPNDLFGKVGSLLDATEDSYVNEGVMTDVPSIDSTGNDDLFIPAPMPGQIEAYN